MTSISLREDLLQLLYSHRARLSEKSAIVERIVSFVESDSACAERSNSFGHLTASAWVVNKTFDKVLLLHHKKLARWLQLGGHADGEFNLLSVALREAQEESGLVRIQPIKPSIFDIDIHEIPAWDDTAAHLHFDVRFLFCADEDETICGNHESNHVAWIALGDVPSYTDEESVLRMVRLTCEQSLLL